MISWIAEKTGANPTTVKLLLWTMAAQTVIGSVLTIAALVWAVNVLVATGRSADTVQAERYRRRGDYTTCRFDRLEGIIPKGSLCVRK